MSREHTPPHAKLPSLHEVLGDVLDQRPASRATSRDTSSTSSSRRSGVSSTVMRFLSEQPCLIPYHQHSSPSRSSSTPSHSHPPHPSAHPQQYRPPYHAQPQPVPQTPNGAPDHSFHLFSIVPEQGLVHQRSSTRDDLDPTMPKPRLPPQDPARKYVCSECGNRFSKQSTLRNHHLTHTGERPFACQYPGCGRRFSMACNMQRHMRTHTSASAFENPPPHAMGYDRASSTGSSREGSVPMAHSPNGHGRY